MSGSAYGIWYGENYKGTTVKHNPFLQVTPDAVTADKCGICHGGGLVKYLECRSWDSGRAPIFICPTCQCLYNATAEFNSLDVMEWQAKWGSDPELHKVPTREDFDEQITRSGGVFAFFESDLDHKFSGTYLDIGAGSGMMAAAALNYFDDVYAMDHVKDRLREVQAIKGEHYHIIDYDEALSIKADLVLIWHAMEHFLEPGNVFEFAASRLKPSGWLLIQVPIFANEHVYPGHYYFYNQIAFTQLAKTNGLRVHKFYYDYEMNGIAVAMQR